MARSINELRAREKPEIVAAAEEQAAEVISDIRLAKIRNYVEVSQQELAEALNITQPSVEVV